MEDTAQGPEWLDEPDASEVVRAARRVAELLGSYTATRCRDVVQLEHGGERGIVVLITAEAVELRLPTLEWPGPDVCHATSRLWRRVGWRELSDGNLKELLRQAIKARRREFRRCRCCGELTPPEHRIQTTCHACASERDGVVF